MPLTLQLPLAVTSLRPKPDPFPEWVRLPGIRVESKRYPFSPGEIITGKFSLTGRVSHLQPNMDWATRGKYADTLIADDIIDCDFSEIEKRVIAHHTGDINFEMTTGNVWDFFEAALGPVYLGCCGPSDRVGFRRDPVDGLLYYRVSTDLEFPMPNTDTGTELNAEDYPESRRLSPR